LTVAPVDGLRTGCANKVTTYAMRATKLSTPATPRYCGWLAERRALITIDTDFGTLVYLAGAAHAGIIRLPDVPARSRIALVEHPPRVDRG
jgi:hypothetical protein